MTTVGEDRATTSSGWSELTRNIEDLASEWSLQREERQRRHALAPADFQRLRDAGYLEVGVPDDLGGLWTNSAISTRLVTGLLRSLAKSDASLALVCAMHPAVLQANAEARGTGNEAWEEQRRWIFQTVKEGAFWGTVVSEPGSGGDTKLTKSEVRQTPDGTYLLSGIKHFGSGSGITSFMITTARLEGNTGPEPDSFILDVRGVPWDGSAGMKLLAEWDGHGMSATQSHSFQFSDFPVIRSLRSTTFRSGFFQAACAGIILGIVEAALSAARERLAGHIDTLEAYEEVEWTNAEMEYWLMEQAWEGMLRAIEYPSPASPQEILQGKTSIARLAETVLTRLCRIMGGSTYGRGSPFGFWFEDVRALGFLRPPWLLAYAGLSNGLRTSPRF